MVEDAEVTGDGRRDRDVRRGAENEAASAFALRAQPFEQVLAIGQRSRIEADPRLTLEAKRAIDEASDTKEWLLGCLGKSCGSCGDCLPYGMARTKAECNLTA